MINEKLMFQLTAINVKEMRRPSVPASFRKEKKNLCDLCDLWGIIEYIVKANLQKIFILLASFV